MIITEERFVFSAWTASPFVISLPHDGLHGNELDGIFEPRTWGIAGKEFWLSAIANDVNRGEPVASIVRGLLPRKLCDYNRPLEGEDRAVADERLIPHYSYYHHTLRGTLNIAAEVRNPAILIDLHGFMRKEPAEPDLVIGTCSGETVRDGLDERVREFLTAQGFRTHIAPVGERFSGGFTVQTYGGKNGVSAIQIEVASDVRNDMGSGKKLATALRALLVSGI
jgi:N-formylglutamate amidohydrolase